MGLPWEGEAFFSGVEAREPGPGIGEEEERETAIGGLVW